MSGVSSSKIVLPPASSGWLYVGGASAEMSAPEAAPTQPASLAAHPRPTPEQLRNLTAVPLSMFSASQRRGKKSGGGKSKALSIVPDGKVVAKFYNAVAGRPYPALTSLEQQIEVTLTQTLGPTGFMTSSTSIPAYGSYFIQLSSFPDSSQYTGLFDQYWIRQVEAWIEPLQRTEAVMSAEYVTAVDLDDANVPTSYADVCQKQGALVATTLNGRYHKWRPHIAVAEYSGAFTSFGNQPSGWIDVASPSVQHYGLKGATGSLDGIARNLQLNVRIVVAFRGPAL